MKKILLFLLLGLLPQLIHAQTAKAIWCSGNTTLYFTYDTNTYTAGGTYDGQTITNVYTISATTSYSYASIIPWYSIRQSVTDVVIASNFYGFKPISLAYWFFQFDELKTLNLNNFNTSDVTNMEGVFYFCQKLESIDVSNFNTQKVTNMKRMFANCNVLNVIDVSNFDTPKVTSMQEMFSGCLSLASLDLRNFNTAEVTNMQAMFEYCNNLSSLEVDNSKFKTSKVSNMGEMFRYCGALTSLILNSCLNSFETTSLTNMQNMFYGCKSLTSLDLSNFNTNKVTNMHGVFNSCYSLTSLNVSNFDTSNVTEMANMFRDCRNLTSIDLSHFDTRKVTTMYSLFSNCDELTKITFGKNFSMDNVDHSLSTDNQMFMNCSKLRYIDFFASDDTDAITYERYNKEVSLDMFWGTNSTMVIFLPHGSQTVTDAQNVVYSYGGDETDLRCPEYYSEDKVDIEFPRDFITNKAIYKRTMANNYGSVILPYDFTTNDKIQAYTLDEEHTETMYFRDTQTVPAHTPFAFNVKQKGSGNVVDFTMTDSSNSFGITVKATHTTHPDEKGWDGVAGTPYSSNTNLAGWTAKGYYVNQTIEKTDPLYSDLHYIAGEKFYKAAGETLIFPPHRVTFHGTWAKGNTSSGAKSFVFAASSDEVVTAIEEAETRQTLRDAEAIYDLAGRRQHEAQKGVNIVRMKDGSVRKMFVK